MGNDSRRTVPRFTGHMCALISRSLEADWMSWSLGGKKKKKTLRPGGVTPARSSCANQVAKHPWQKKALLRLTELSPSVWSVGGIWKRLAWRLFFFCIFFSLVFFFRGGGEGCGEVGWCVWGDPLPCLFVRVSRGRRKGLRSLGTESGAYANNHR